MKAPVTRRLADPDSEVARRAHHEAIRELQTAPAAALRPLGAFEFPDGIEVRIAHGLGRAPHWAAPSAIRAPSTVGMIEEIRDGVDRSRFVVFKASGYGATVTADVLVL